MAPSDFSQPHYSIRHVWRPHSIKNTRQWNLYIMYNIVYIYHVYVWMCHMCYAVKQSKYYYKMSEKFMNKAVTRYYNKHHHLQIYQSLGTAHEAQKTFANFNNFTNLTTLQNTFIICIHRHLLIQICCGVDLNHSSNITRIYKSNKFLWLTWFKKNLFPSLNMTLWYKKLHNYFVVLSEG